jgi:hypothetical protein
MSDSHLTPRIRARFVLGDAVEIAQEMRDLLEQPDEQIMAMHGAEQLLERVRRATELLVVNAREHGATWAEVGEAFGITRQAAYERFRAACQHPADQIAPA